MQLSASQTRTATSSPRSDQGDWKKVLDTTVTDEAASLGGEFGTEGEGRKRKKARLDLKRKRNEEQETGREGEMKSEQD